MSLQPSAPHAASPSPQPSTGATLAATHGMNPHPHGLIVRQSLPPNFEMPFDSLDGFITPVPAFFVRCHFPVPELTREHWRLHVTGRVRRPLELKWDDLAGLPRVSVTATLECAGNGRVFLSPSVDGAQWERGAVGTAVWTGIRLRDLLERAGVLAEAREVILVGADEGEIEKPPRPAGKIHYSRSLPLAKADEVVLAFEMNGEPLTASHGFPLRAVVPGWYGMASVKWLTEIILTHEPFQGYYQTVDYAYWSCEGDQPTLVPITEMLVKAQIARPSPAEVVPAGESYRVHGAAWSGDAEIARVEVSVDGGETWHDARLGEEAGNSTWRLWEYSWQVPKTPGRAVLVARATDHRGRTQPVRRDENRGSYLINELLGVEVTIA